MYNYLISLSPSVGLAEDIVLRASLAALTAFLASLFLGAKLIEKLKDYKVSEDTAKTHSPELRVLHAGKKDTPTMGGIIILLAVFLSTALWSNLWDYSIKVVLFTAMGLAMLGFVDDYLKLTVKDSFGLRDKTKLFFQLCLGLLLGIVLY